MGISGSTPSAQPHAGASTSARMASAMQLGANSLAQGATALHQFMAQMPQRPPAAVGVYGGCGADGADADDGYFGGGEEEPASSLAAYANSRSAKAKEQMVSRLAKAFQNMKINVDADADIGTIAKALAAELPNPKRGESIDGDAKAHTDVCKAVAKVLNDEFTPGAKASEQLIDTSLPPADLCARVSEWAQSFTQGVHVEFMAVHASVSKALKALQVLDEVIRSLTTRVLAEAESSAEPGEARSRLEQVAEVLRRAQAERMRQEMLLSNILHTQLSPANEVLEIAMRDSDELGNMVAKLGLKPGTSDFADSVAAAISGTATAATAAAAVQKALKTAGIEVKAYLDNDLKAFNDYADSFIQSGKIPAAKLTDVIEAISKVRQTFANAAELAAIRAHLRESAASAESVTLGGAPEKTAVEKRVDKRKAEKKILISDFVQRIGRRYAELLSTVDAIAPELGKTIPLSSQTDVLRDAMKQLAAGAGSATRVEYALIGLYADASAREVKEKYLAGMRMVVRACEILQGLEAYSGASAILGRLKSAAEEIVKTIDFFTDVVRTKYGGDRGDDGAAIDGDDLDASAVSDYTGGAARRRHYKGGADDFGPEIARSGLDLSEAVNKFVYFYYVAHVRANLARSSSELEEYGAKYVDLLGDAVAARLFTLASERTRLLAQVEALAGVNATDKTKITAWIEDEFRVKNQFYRAMQALDLYMKAFTDAIARDPDAVTNMARILGSTEMIANWFTDESGTALAAAFDDMPPADGTDNRGVNSLNNAARPAGHYYERVAAAPNAVGMPPGRRPANSDEASDAKAKISLAIDNYQGLKNLVNAFARIGDSFGGRQLHTTIFMGPTAIYKALVDYLKASALSCRESGGSWNVFFPSVLAPGALGPAIPNNQPWATENRYFAAMIKAMAAKVLTVVGVHNMLTKRNVEYDLTPVRVIVGGAAEAEPVAVPEAAELYFRLPRLAEFYRHIFAFDDDTASLRISMLPELEGTFSGLIRLIFQRTRITGAEDDYSDGEARSLLREINVIFERYRDKGAGASRAALEAFVAEINRRYGLIKKKDWESYWKLVFSARSGDMPLRSTTNYAILPGEDDMYDSEIDRRAPSDRFEMGAGVRFDAATGYPLDPRTGQAVVPFGSEDRQRLRDPDAPESARMILRDFRRRLETQLRPDDTTVYGKVSFSMMIDLAAADMRRLTTAAEKLDIALRLIQGGRTISADADKLYMFNETVVTGLNVLRMIQYRLDDFSGSLDNCDPDKLVKVVLGEILTAAAFDVNSIEQALTAAYPPLIFRGPDNINNLFVQFGVTEPYRAAMARAAGVVANVNAAVAGLPAVPARWWESFVAATAPSTLGAAPVPAALAAGMQELLSFARAFVADLQAGNPLTLFTESVFKLTAPGLVECRFSGPDIQLNFSPLQNACEAILADVKLYADLLRPFVSEAIMARYDSAGDISIKAIERDLVDKYFRGGFGSEVADLQRLENSTVNGLTRRATQQLKKLLVCDYAPAGQQAVRCGDVIAAMLWPHGMAHEYGATLPLGAGAGFFSLVRRASTGGAAGALYQIGGIDAERLPIYTSQGDFGAEVQRNVLTSFNEFLAEYVRTFTDSGSGMKIYANLISGYANGVASLAVNSPEGNTYPDLTAANGAGGYVFGDAKPGTLLCTSLAAALNSLLHDVTPNQLVPTHMVATLTDVPLYMKEQYRANLPIFAHAFDLILSKCEFIKQLIQRTRMNVQLTEVLGLANQAAIFIGGGGGAAGVPFVGASANGVVLLDAGPSVVPEEESKSRIIGFIETVISSAATLQNTCGEVLKELGDVPMYLQLHEGFIEQYKSRYSKLPLMPYSTSLWYTRVKPALGRGAGPRPELTPLLTLNSPEFKLMYGGRTVLFAASPKAEQFPGLQQMLGAFNGSVPARDQVDLARANAFFSTLTQCLRWEVDATFYKGLLGPVIASVEPYVVPPANQMYSLKPAATAQSLVSIVENSSQEDALSEIIAALGGETAPDTNRRRQRLLNLVDMNIIPINVHALMRDIPGANLFNYEYTFEQLAASLYGEQVSVVEAAPAESTRQLLLKLLFDPYAPLDSETVSSNGSSTVARLFRGDGNTGMQRPKFLSDQLWNKVLLNSVYAVSADYDEAGPNEGAGYARGVEAARTPHYDILMQAALQEMNVIYMSVLAGLQRIGPLPGALPANVVGAWQQFVAGAQVQNINQNDLRAAMAVAVTTPVFAGIRQALATPALAQKVRDIDGAIMATAQAYGAVGRLVPGTLAGTLAQIRDGDAATLTSFMSRIGDPSSLNSVTLQGMAAPANIANRAADLNVFANPALLPAAPRTWPRGTALSYMKADGDHAEVVEKQLPLEAREALREVAYARFNTAVVRNLIFVTNVNRILRLSMHRALTDSQNVIVTSNSMTAFGVTEFGSDPYTRNQVLGSDRVDGAPSYYK